MDADRRLIEPDRRWLSERAVAALARLRPPRGGEVRVRLVGDDEMSRRHNDYLNDPTTTDVLTFDLARDPSAPLDVDILVCADEAARQASARSVEWREEILLYIIHGALHCSGYDDIDEAGAARMHEKEDEILRAIGVGDVYARGAGGAS